MQTTSKEKQLISGTMFAFMVSGATSLALGSLIPFLRDTYDLSYEIAGMLVSLQSVGNLVSVGLMGFLPVYFYTGNQNFPTHWRNSIMQNVVIGNATYLVNRVFVGERKITDLIQKRMEETCSQLLPLTNSPSASYNHSEEDAGFRRNHAD